MILSKFYFTKYSRVFKKTKKFYLEEKQIHNRLLLVLDQVNSVEMLIKHLGEIIDN